MDSVNRKDDMGRTVLEQILPLMRRITETLDSSGVNYRLLGGSSLGTKLQIPDDYARVRQSSNIFEATFEDTETARKVASIVNDGWKEAPVQDYFSITCKNPDGETVKGPSIRDQSLFYTVRDGTTYFLSPIYVPTEFYRGKKGSSLTIEPIARLVSYGEPIIHKILRSTERDQADVAYVAVMEDFKTKLGPEALELWKNARARKDGRDAWRYDMHVGEVLRRMDTLSRSERYVDRRELLTANASVLAGLVRESEVAAATA